MRVIRLMCIHSMHHPSHQRRILLESRCGTARVAVERELPVKTPLWGKLDFHLHSYASNVTDYYAANALSLPESYSDPMSVYRLLKERGMTLVTLTDHNSIDGVRELLDAGKSDVFISAEMTTSFPEDGCNIHVTIANMTEPQFAEIQRLRTNVYEMIAYVDGQMAAESEDGNHLAYFMTHPLMSTQNRPYGREGSLSIEHIEKALLFCPCFEVRNGSRTKALNELTLGMLEALDRPTIERLAEKHGIAPRGDVPWRKGLVGGSDDHSGINPGRTWTEFPYAARPTPNDVIDALRRRATRPAGRHGGPITLAHSVLKLLYDGSTRKQASGAKAISIGGPVHALLRLAFDSGRQNPASRLWFYLKIYVQVVWARLFGARGSAGEPFEQIFQSEVYGLLAAPTFRAALARLDAAETDERIFLAIGALLHRIFARYLDNLRDGGRLNLVGFIRQAVALATSNALVTLPYLMSFLQQTSDCIIARDARRAFGLEERQKVVLVTDTFFDINGVAATIKRMIREAFRRNIDFTVVTCLADHEREEHLRDPEIRRFVDSGMLKLFTPIAQMDFPEYDRLQIRFPPFLDMLRYLQESGFTKMQISTPGIMGLLGLLAAKTLQIETAATYHTSIPEYVENYTRDISLEAIAWKYMIAFYHSVDEVLVPSKFVARLLHKRGLRNRKLLILDRWVDVDRFHPRKRTAGFWKKFGIDDEDALVKFIYVGRIGVEKNLRQVADAYRALRETRTECHLFIVGDGPYREELEKRLSGTPVTFTGFLEKEELCCALASADVKVFPSTTDTWGNAPLEAQASGIPVIVSVVGGPAELMVDGVTGLKVSGRDTGELRDAMAALMAPELRLRLGRQARAFAEARRVKEPFTAIFDAEAFRRRLREENSRDDPSPSTSEVVDFARLYFVNDGDLNGSKHVA
jgi:glycosyltransferase involved in cell wall biosynthesis